MLAKDFTNRYGRATAKDIGLFYQAVSDLAAGVRLQSQKTKKGDDVIILPDPLEVGIEVMAHQMNANGKTWVFNDLLRQEDVTSTIQLAQRNGRRVHIFYLDTNHRISPRHNAAGFIPSLCYDATADQESPRERDHASLCWNNNHGPEGIIREASEAGVVTFSLVKVLRYAGFGTSSEIQKGIRFAAEANTEADLNIISMSFGDSGNGDGAFWKSLFGSILDSKPNLILVASNGNSGGTGNPSRIGWPSKMDEIISSAAYDQRRDIASFSSQGPESCIAAPGVNTPSRDWNNNPINWSGTSSSCPYNAAIIALIGLRVPQLIRQDTMKSYVEKWATDLGRTGFDVAFGHGATIFDKYVDKSPVPTPPAPPTPPNPPTPPAPPTPPVVSKTAAKTVTGPFTLRWNTVSDHERKMPWRFVIVQSITASAKGKTADAASVYIDEIMKQYFIDQSVAMVVPDSDGATEVLAYLGLFIPYFSRAKGQEVLPSYFVGYNERGLQLEAIARVPAQETAEAAGKVLTNEPLQFVLG